MSGVMRALGKGSLKLKAKINITHNDLVEILLIVI